MLLYNSIGPNPRIVRMFLAEKGVELDRVEIDIVTGDNRNSDYQEKVNPTGQTPALQLDDGSVITEVTTICDYLEELHPGTALIGSTPEERAVTRMWCRRIDLNITEIRAIHYRSGPGYEFFKDRVPTLPEAADGLLAFSNKGLEWLESQINDSDYIAGERFSLADILLFCWFEFFGSMGIGFNDDFPRLKDWYQRVEQRPSVSASA